MLLIAGLRQIIVASASFAERVPAAEAGETATICPAFRPCAQYEQIESRRSTNGIVNE